MSKIFIKQISDEESIDDSIVEVYRTPSYADEMTMDDVRKLLVREVGMTHEKADFVVDYLQNFKEVYVDTETKTFDSPR